MADAPSGAPGAERPRYLVTARKYRPQTFADLVAQDHVAETLRNAIRADRLAHAYLFSGPRGVGKTTAARLLAKAVNCQTPLSERPDAEPCRTCEACVAFEEGRSLNVIEIDAASNNRVEDIRDLRDTVRVPPQGANKKVYILDEVHMLSASAFNALLKTLEEPPPYVLFIFATTEPHKVLPTILSRTQRFDFRRIAVPEIVGQLRTICEQEGVEADDESLVLIARKGDGALRDALSLFDQSVSLCGAQLTGAALREALGVVDLDLYFEATDRAAAGDRAGLLALVDGLVGRGYDLPEFVLGLSEHVRNLLVARSTGRGDLIEGTDAAKERYVNAAEAWAEADLLHLLMLADGCAGSLRDSRQPRLTVELALLKMATLAKAADLDRLLAKLGALEKAAAEGRLAAPPATPPAPKAEATPPARPAATAEPGASYTAPASTPTASATQPTAAPEPDASAPSANRPDDDDGGVPTPPDRPAPPEAPAPADPRTAPAASFFGPPALRRARPSGDSGGDGATAALAGSPGDGQTGPAPAPPVADDGLGGALVRVREAWPALVAGVRQSVGVRLASVLSAGWPLRMRRGAVEVALGDAFAVRIATDGAEAIRAALADALGAEPPALRFVDEPQATPETAAEADPFERLKQLRQEHPVVRALFETFGAEIVYQ